MGPLDKSDASLDALSVVIKQGTLSLRETVDEEKAQLRLTRPRVFRKTRRFILFFLFDTKFAKTSLAAFRTQGGHSAAEAGGFTKIPNCNPNYKAQDADTLFMKKIDE